MTLETLRSIFAPMRAATIKVAEQRTRCRADMVYSRLGACGWDLMAAYPMPNAKMSKIAYETANAARLFARSVTRVANPNKSRHSVTDPLVVAASAASLDLVVAEERKAAAEAFDAYLVKLAGKTGPVTSATLQASGGPNNVWIYGVLTVRRPDGSTAVYTTQRIINVSKLGKLFYKWPTRLKKGAR